MENTSEDVQRINLDEILDISSAGELKSQFLLLLESNENIVIEASNVERADTSALQALLAFIQDVRAQGKEVQWQDPSDSFLRSAGLIGLSDLLGLKSYYD